MEDSLDEGIYHVVAYLLHALFRMPVTSDPLDQNLEGMKIAL